MASKKNMTAIIGAHIILGAYDADQEPIVTMPISYYVNDTSGNKQNGRKKYRKKLGNGRYVPIRTDPKIGRNAVKKHRAAPD